MRVIMQKLKCGHHYLTYGQLNPHASPGNWGCTISPTHNLPLLAVCPPSGQTLLQGGKTPPFPFHFCIKNGQFWTLDPLFDVPKGEKFGVPKPQLWSIMGGDWGDRCSTSVHGAMPLAWCTACRPKRNARGLHWGWHGHCIFGFFQIWKIQKVRGEKTSLGGKNGPFLMQKSTLNT